MLETLESPLDCKEIQPVNTKGNQPLIFIGRTEAEAEGPQLWPPDAKNWLTGKDPNAGKDWRQEEKGMTEDEMVGWHHQFNGYEFEQTLGNSEGQGNLCAAVHGIAKSWTQLSDWTTANVIVCVHVCVHVHRHMQGLSTRICHISGTKDIKFFPSPPWIIPSSVHND